MTFSYEFVELPHPYIQQIINNYIQKYPNYQCKLKINEPYACILFADGIPQAFIAFSILSHNTILVANVMSVLPGLLLYKGKQLLDLFKNYDIIVFMDTNPTEKWKKYVNRIGMIKRFEIWGKEQ